MSKDEIKEPAAGEAQAIEIAIDPVAEVVEETAVSASDPASAPKKEYAPVSVTTRIDLGAHAALARMNILGSWLPFAVLTVVCMAFGGLMWGFLDDDAASVGITFLVLGAVIPFGFFGIMYWLARFNSRKIPGAKTIRTVSLVFKENITGTETVLPQEEGAEPVVKAVSYEYADFVKVRESKEYFILFADARSAMVISKRGITEGTNEDLRGILYREIENRQADIKG